MDDQKALAEAIIAKRTLARRRFLPFLMSFEPTYIAGWVHQDICARLEKFERDVQDGLSPRLMITMPPRHGKSMICSQYFPAWYLGRNPQDEIIATSYSSSLAGRFSRSVRQIFRDPDMHSLFPGAQLDPDAQSIETWMTLEGGSYTSAGVGGGITGKGAHVLIIDDPIKSAEDAESETYREMLWEWYVSTAYTRLAPGGGVLIIQTRWHHDDLSGRLLEKGAEGEGDLFELVNYPALALHDEQYRSEGEPLHPDRYPFEALKMIRRTVGPRVWSALYQQQPTEDSGSYFKAEWMRYYDKPPPLDELQVYAAWDLAIGQREHNDFSVGTVVGIDVHHDVWVLDQIAGRWNAKEIVERILDLAELWRPTQVLIEKGHIDMAIGPFLTQRQMERGLNWVAFKSLPTGRRDKQARARGIQGMFQTSRVKLPKYGGWVDKFVQELLTFPFGKHDDRVDSIAWIGLYLTEMVPGRIKAVKKKKSWRDNLQQYVKRSDVDANRSWLAS